MIGFPWDGGASLGAPGGRYGPDAVRGAIGWWLDRVRGDRIWDVEAGDVVDLGGLRLRDRGDVAIAGHDTEATFAAAAELIGAAHDAGEIPIVIGGDHSITIPAVQALADRSERFGVVQLDAHLDLVDDSPAQGRLSQSSPMRRAIELEQGSARRLVQIGLRSFNYPEFHAWCREKGITQLTAAQAVARGADQVAEAALATATADGARLYLTVDLDCLDPGVAPGVGHQEPGGLPFAFVSAVVRRLAPHVDALDVAELNPMRDPLGVTAGIAARLVLDFAVARARATAPALVSDRVADPAR
ncbi:arginase family protein [Conexibacter sp. CPCC 206217]|uniref:arginase family protein n=1 Tax=Conexibacter sp. CPCC 206217 TaxID=3064574 RepID=UPI00271B49C6|nr:arginase family protein [Conexibacter sp. CPCC 206217]MDO8210246.1 arginase family protein [Conexibacter sp. CPCC 206217]